MTASNNGSSLLELPCVIFAGDYNTGKSALINALIRKEILYSARRESRSLPAFLGASAQPGPSFAALRDPAGPITAQTHDAFLSTRRDENNAGGHTALAARVPGIPFGNLLFVDTAGTSTDDCETMDFSGFAHRGKAMLVLVTDIEYWSARHTMDAISAHRETFGDNLIIVANKADHLNAKEIRRICAKATQRLEDYGIAPAPRYLALSARLESARRDQSNEYRNRTKAEVRGHCDAAFDAFRVALYEFEAVHAPGINTFEQMLHTPLAASIAELQQDHAHEVQ